MNNICVMNFSFHNVMINGHTLTNVKAVERTFSEHLERNIIFWTIINTKLFLTLLINITEPLFHLLSIFDSMLTVSKEVTGNTAPCLLQEQIQLQPASLLKTSVDFFVSIQITWFGSKSILSDIDLPDRVRHLRVTTHFEDCQNF